VNARRTDGVVPGAGSARTRHPALRTGRISKGAHRASAASAELIHGAKDMKHGEVVIWVCKDNANKTRDLLAKRWGIKSELATDPEKWEFRLPEEEWQAVEEDLRAAKIPVERKK